MYQEYYGLNENPFNITADTRFLYWSENHRNAFRHLAYSVQSGKGIIALSGEVGTGKTTILNVLIKRLNEPNDKINISYIYDSKMSIEDMFRCIFNDFLIENTCERRSDYILALRRFLLQCAQKKERVLLILDEAQNFSYDILEDIRLLSNIETPREKLLQVILAGQPQLVKNIENIYQLKQRIHIIYNLLPLGFEDVGAYIQKRLEIAGVNDRSLFSEKAIEGIYEYSRGVPRIINLICDNALLYGYAAQKKQIDRKIVGQVAKDMALTNEGKSSSTYSDDMAHGDDHGNKKPDKHADNYADKFIIEHAKRSIDRGSNKDITDDKIKSSRGELPENGMGIFRERFVGLIKIMVSLTVVLLGVFFIKTSFSKKDKESVQLTSKYFIEVQEEPLLNSKKITDEIKEGNTVSVLPTQSKVIHHDIDEGKVTDGFLEDDHFESNNANKVDSNNSNTGGNFNSESPQERPSVIERKAESVIVVQPGDTLEKILVQEYGEYSQYALNLVLEANPRITNRDRIFVGQHIRLPKP